MAKPTSNKRKKLVIRKTSDATNNTERILKDS